MVQDFRFACRTLLRSPGFTITAAVTLALGIGVTSLMFGVVNAVLLRPLPYPDQDRLMMVFNVNSNAPEANTIRAHGARPARTTVRGHGTFASMAGHIGNGFTFTGDGNPELVIGQMVTADFFNVIGVAPAHGRTFAPDEFSPGANRRAPLAPAVAASLRRADVDRRIASHDQRQALYSRRRDARGTSTIPGVATSSGCR